MTPPPFLLGCTVIFWGWQIHLLIVAIPMAIILETARWVNWRWNLSDKDFNRVTDWSSLALVIVAIYLFDQKSLHGLMTLLSWLPIILFLLLTIQIYSIQNSVKLTSLFYSLRRQEAKGVAINNAAINLSYPYIMVCLLAASVGRGTWFFAGMILLIAWGLWTIRPKRYTSLHWLLLVMVATISAYNTQLGLHNLQTEVEILILDWLEDFFLNKKDPYKQNTAIGDIGRLKQSDKILLRVETTTPLNLRSSSYNLYFGTTWYAKQPVFKTISPTGNGTIWQFTPYPKINDKVRISGYLNRGKGILPIPNGSQQISNFVVPILKTNNFGAIKVEQGPELAIYTAHFGQSTPLDATPTKYDLQLPEKEQNYLLALSKQLNLSNQQPSQALATIAQYFEQNFSYTLNLTTSKSATPLQSFLQHTKAGHCEYFATATTLLLRTVGIPSRYTSGYAVTEYSGLEDVYIVRRRHAHAWTIAYVDGRWQEIDNTPAIWVDFEEDKAAWWEPIYDVFSWLHYKFSYWRWTDDEDGNNSWLLWLILPLILALVWRLYLRERISHVHKQESIAMVGDDSEFNQIIQYLDEKNYVRQSGENLTQWLQRISITRTTDIQLMLSLHQQHRFDPNGLNAEERLQLKKKVAIWLKNHKF
ncbi:transglutaminase-like domain-containing protein [Candidatus Halobeggiatoa sp. HSG11]|nr:transglutaminase-like domain-containing protein [Candidatus Halobeggiatoa sp. HSG11]